MIFTLLILPLKMSDWKAFPQGVSQAEAWEDHGGEKIKTRVFQIIYFPLKLHPLICADGRVQGDRTLLQILLQGQGRWVLQGLRKCNVFGTSVLALGFSK